MDKVTRLILQRLSENSFIDTPMIGNYNSETKKIMALNPLINEGEVETNDPFTLGIVFLPLRETIESRPFDGLYKLVTERYLIQYWGSGGEFFSCAGRYLMEMKSGREGDTVFYTVSALRDRLPKDLGTRWSVLGPMRWLTRTLGSLKEGSDGEPYYDDSYESRLDWAYLQTQQAYETGLNDPLERVEDGWIWRALFERAFKSETPDPIGLTFGLRYLRAVCKMRFESTRGGLKMRGSADGGWRFKELMKRLDVGEWFKEQVEEIRRRGNDACGLGKAEGIEEAVFGA